MRVFKTRPIATEACRAGSVEINERVAKPAREVHAGEVVKVKLGLFTRTLRVVGVPRSRVGAKLLPDFCVDLTPPEEFEKLRERSVQQASARESGSGRPTKRERREIDGFFG
jgi:ribosome-associated heat shock protein Hsp15